MSEKLTLDELKTIGDKFLEQYPEACRKCPSVALSVITTKSNLFHGNITHEKASEYIYSHAKDIETFCRIGQTIVDNGCFDVPDCNYGIIKD